MGSKVTIDQVAAICGVSKTTISRYLNHKYENISAETRQRIEQVITVAREFLTHCWELSGVEIGH